jgi:ketosteroid isomerase-like protein
MNRLVPVHPKTSVILALALVLLTPMRPGRAAETSALAVAQLWVQRLAATMEQHATAGDVDRLLELYRDDAVYEHPHAGARIEGKALMRSGISEHLGETRAPRIQITRSMAGEDFAVVELSVNAEVQQDTKWIPLERRQVVVIEFKNSHIQRIIDHWSR